MDPTTTRGPAPRDGRTFRTWVSDLEECGLSVQPLEALNALEITIRLDDQTLALVLAPNAVVDLVLRLCGAGRRLQLEQTATIDGDTWALP
jgi:hypothetical protein